MSDGNEFQNSDAATGNVRRSTVASRNGGTSSWCDEADYIQTVKTASGAGSSKGIGVTEEGRVFEMAQSSPVYSSIENLV